MSPTSRFTAEVHHDSEIMVDTRARDLPTIFRFFNYLPIFNYFPIFQLFSDFSIIGRPWCVPWFIIIGPGVHHDSISLDPTLARHSGTWNQIRALFAPKVVQTPKLVDPSGGGRASIYIYIYNLYKKTNSATRALNDNSTEKSANDLLYFCNS